MIVQRIAIASPAVPVLVLAAAVVGLIRVAAAEPTALDPSQVIVVTEDSDVRPRGCDALSVFQRDGSGFNRIYVGQQQVSPGRLAATTDFRAIVATASNEPHLRPFLYVAQRVGQSWRTTAPVRGASFALLGGIAVMPDHDTLLVAMTGHMPNARATYVEPFSVRKFRLFDIRPSGDSTFTIGAPTGSFRTDGPVAEILLASDDTAHLVSTGAVETIRVSSMTRAATAVPFARRLADPDRADGHVLGRTFASVDASGRWMVINRWGSAEIVLVDLQRRVSSEIALPGLANSGGVAIGRTSGDRILLAVHAVDSVVLFWLATGGAITHVSDVSVSPVPFISEGWLMGPMPSVSWFGAGDYLIAASSNLGTSSGFDLISISIDDQSLEIVDHLAPCSEGWYPNDVLTQHDVFLPPVPPSPSPTPTATGIATSSATLTPPATNTDEGVRPTPSAAVSPTSSWTPSPTASASWPTSAPSPTTAVPAPIYLPIGLRESCPPKDLYLDVALVIDASTSMLDVTAVGSTKLELAVESVGLFLDNLRLEPGRDRAAIVTFNDRARTIQRLTSEREALTSALRRISTANYSRLVLGIERAMVELIARGNTTHLQAMVVLSDGKANPVPGDEAVAAAKRAHLEGITIYVVGLGPSMDERVLREMASGDDRYVAAPDPVAIPSIYRDLTQRVACPPEVFWGRP